MGEEGLVEGSDMARRGREEKKGGCCQATVRPTTASLRIRRLHFTVNGYNSVRYGYSEQRTHICSLSSSSQRFHHVVSDRWGDRCTDHRELYSDATGEHPPFRWSSPIPAYVVKRDPVLPGGHEDPRGNECHLLRDLPVRI